MVGGPSETRKVSTHTYSPSLPLFLFWDHECICLHILPFFFNMEPREFSILTNKSHINALGTVPSPPEDGTRPGQAGLERGQIADCWVGHD